MICLFTVAFEQHIRLANGIGLRVDLLPEQVNGDILSAPCCQRLKSLLRHGEHTSRSAGSVIAGIGSVLDLIGNRHEDKVGHQFHNITGRPMFPGFLVVFFVETANQFLENRAHAVIVQSRMLEDGFLFILINRIGTEVNIRGHELFNHRTENVRLNHGINLIAEFELL